VGGVLVDAPKEGIAESIVLEVDGVGAVQARLARRARNGALAYVFADPRQRPYLIRKILCGSEYVPIPSSWTPVNALFGFLRGVMPRWTRLRV
jgi:hypothetical protein